MTATMPEACADEAGADPRQIGIGIAAIGEEALRFPLADARGGKRLGKGRDTPTRGGVELWMPLARYFLLVGAALLAMLFVAGASLPSPPAVERVEAQRTTIRVRSEMKLPERVVFDTSIPAVTYRADPAVSATPTPTTPSTNDASASAQQAFARMQSSDLKKLADAKRPEIRSAPPRKSEARRRAAVPRKVRLARQHQFDWFSGRMYQ